MSAVVGKSPRDTRRKAGGVSVIFPMGARLYDANRAAGRVYLLRSGGAQLASGRGAIVDYLSPGDFFGEKCLLGDRCESQVAKSLSRVEVSAFRKTELLDRLQHDRRFAIRLLKNLARRLDRYEQTIQDSVTEQAERRLARLLLRFLPAGPADGWVRLRFSPSNAELAKTIGTTRSRIAHFMGRFQRLGWLDRRPDLWVRSEGLREFLQATAKQR